MALIDKLSFQRLEKDISHKAVECTYFVVQGTDGRRYLQLDTYGSAERKIKGKKSQSLRFTDQAIKQLRQIMDDNKL
jgi:hypothetical protein